jgi:phosphoribosylformimino-5-aminoimidazole carboxamide ribotide isomerase
MRVLPVIDLKGGLVVRGVGGRRDDYKPIESRLCSDAQLETVLATFASLGFPQAYVADLDAIEKGTGAFAGDSTREFSGLASPDLMVDAGIRNLSDARALDAVRVNDRPLAGIVAGLESLDSPSTLAAMLQAVGAGRLVFSLDMKRGLPLTAAPAWQALAPLAIATLALRLGVRRFILLDLAQVGMGAGVGTESLCRALRCLAPSVEIISGGGVRGQADLDLLARAGCDAALVASALHDGRLDAGACIRRNRAGL